MTARRHAQQGAHRVRIGLAMMVKTPGVSALKTRLAKDVGAPVAEAFYLGAVSALTTTFECAKLKCAAGVEDGEWAKGVAVELHPFYAVMEQAQLNNPLWARLPTLWQGEGGLGEKLDTVYATLLEKFDGAIVVGSDLPHLGEQALVSTAVALGRNSSVFHVGPTDDGGFYLFAGAQPIPREVWTSVPYSSTETYNCLVKALAPLGHLHPLGMSFDIDEGRDLARLRSNFSTLVDQAPALRAFENEGWFHSVAAPHAMNWENVP